MQTVWIDPENRWTVYLNDDNTIRIVTPGTMTLYGVEAINFSNAISAAAWKSIERERELHHGLGG